MTTSMLNPVHDCLTDYRLHLGGGNGAIPDVRVVVGRHSFPTEQARRHRGNDANTTNDGGGI